MSGASLVPWIHQIFSHLNHRRLSHFRFAEVATFARPLLLEGPAEAPRLLAEFLKENFDVKESTGIFFSLSDYRTDRNSSSRFQSRHSNQAEANEGELLRKMSIISINFRSGT